MGFQMDVSNLTLSGLERSIPGHHLVKINILNSNHGDDLLVLELEVQDHTCLQVPAVIAHA